MANANNASTISSLLRFAAGVLVGAVSTTATILSIQRPYIERIADERAREVEVRIQAQISDLKQDIRELRSDVLKALNDR